MYKAGCRGCDSPDYTPDLCNECIEQSKQADTTEIEGMTQLAYLNQYPPMDTELEQPDIEMSERNDKRASANGTETTEQPEEQPTTKQQRV